MRPNTAQPPVRSYEDDHNALLGDHGEHRLTLRTASRTANSNGHRVDVFESRCAWLHESAVPETLKAA